MHGNLIVAAVMAASRAGFGFNFIASGFVGAQGASKTLFGL
jgi:hypothetical protein